MNKPLLNCGGNFSPTLHTMKRKAYTSLIIIGLLSAIITHAQPDSLKNRIQVKMGIYHNSYLNYYGRTGGQQSSGTFPMLELWVSKHFYVNAAPVFVHNSSQKFGYAGTVATAGLLYNDHEKWRANLLFTKPFYKDNSSLVQSALKAQGSALVTLKNQFLNITGGGDVKISGRIDYGVTTGVDHIFRLQLNRSILVINPSAYLYAGTQQFTNTYYQKNNFLIFPGVEEAVSENVQQFNILSYELSAPIILAKGKYQFLFIPSYVMPQNLIEIPDHPELSEQGKNLFYATAGVKLSF